MSPRALACPASLKGCLSAAVAAERAERGLRARPASRATQMPIADGGEGTVDVLCSEFEEVETVDAFGRPRVARAGVLGEARVVEAAEAIPLDPSRLDVMAASSRGLGLWIAQLQGRPLVVTVGGTATMDAGAGMLEVLDRLPGPTRVLCDVATKLRDAPRLFGPQKGATPEQVAELEERFRGVLEPWAELPGSGAAGGLGAALASLGAELVPGADAVLDLLGFEPVRLRPRRHRRGDGRRDDVGGEGAVGGRRAAARRRRSGASSSAGACSRATRSRSAATRRGPRRTSSSSVSGSA